MDGSIRRRGEHSWEINLNLGMGPDGKRRRQFHYVKGEEEDAKRKLRELLSQMDHGITPSNEKITVAQWLETWLADHVATTTRVRTYERYQTICRKYLVPNLGRLRLANLSPKEIKAFEAKLLRDGASPALAELIHNVLSGALKYAVRMEVIWRNPAKAVTPPKVPHKEIRPPDLDCVRKILARGRADNHPLYPALHLVAYTGIRRGECLGLTWRHVDLKQGRISITQSLCRSLHDGVIFQPTKTERSRRTIDLDADTVAILKEHQVRQMENRLKAGKHYEDNDLVFPDDIGHAANPMILTRTYQSLAKKVGAPRGRLHDLRHFHASLLFQQGESAVLVQQRLGHSTVVTTINVYGHLLPGHQKAAAQRFADAMRG